jgi:hypothetical protein
MCGALCLREGASASLAAVALLFVGMDHDMLLALSPAGPAVLVVAELLLRVHAALFVLTSYTSKDVAESAFGSGHPSSTVAWSATGAPVEAIVVMIQRVRSGLLSVGKRQAWRLVTFW